MHVVVALAAVVAFPAAAARPATGTLCLDPVGETVAPVCRSFQASRIVVAPDVCQCPGGVLQVQAPYCAAGEAPQRPTRAFELARRAAAERDLTLVGKAFHGRSYCIAGP